MGRTAPTVTTSVVASPPPSAASPAPSADDVTFVSCVKSEASKPRSPAHDMANLKMDLFLGSEEYTAIARAAVEWKNSAFVMSSGTLNSPSPSIARCACLPSTSATIGTAPSLIPFR